MDTTVKLSVYNVKGEFIDTLIDKKMIKGNHSVLFNGEAFNSGVYYYILEAGDIKRAKKMVLVH